LRYLENSGYPIIAAATGPVDGVEGAVTFYAGNRAVQRVGVGMRGFAFDVEPSGILACVCGVLKVWDVRQGRMLLEREGVASGVRLWGSCAVLMGDSVALLDLRTGRPERQLWCEAVDCCQWGDSYILCGRRPELVYYDSRELSQIGKRLVLDTRADAKSRSMVMAVQPGGRSVAVGTSRSLLFADLETREVASGESAGASRHGSPVTHVAFHPRTFGVAFLREDQGDLYTFVDDCDR
jgi:hypothetical protein